MQISMPTSTKHPYTQITLIIIAISSALLGLSMLLMGHHKAIETITNFYGVSELAAKPVLNAIAAMSFLIAAGLAVISVKFDKFRPLLGAVLVGISTVPLIGLLSSAMWIESLGGFPAIGSGQGVIKYAALLSIGLLLLAPNLSVTTKKWLSVIPVILVLIWIGGMKFTLLEAKGIEDLVVSSPLMSWMYGIWDLQTTSNLIGVYDLVAVVLLISAMFNRRFLLPAIAMSGAVFVVTQTFLITWDAALSSETLLSGGGHFLIKDLWYIGNLLMLWQLSNEQELSKK